MEHTCKSGAGTRKRMYLPLRLKVGVGGGEKTEGLQSPGDLSGTEASEALITCFLPHLPNPLSIKFYLNHSTTQGVISMLHPQHTHLAPSTTQLLSGFLTRTQVMGVGQDLQCLHFIPTPWHGAWSVIKAHCLFVQKERSVFLVSNLIILYTYPPFPHKTSFPPPKEFFSSVFLRSLASLRGSLK